VRRVDRVAHLGEGRTGVELQLTRILKVTMSWYEMHNLGRLVGGDPLAVIAGNRGAGDVLAPGRAAILAGRDVTFARLRLAT